MLFVLATPIGNLGDITNRALEVLKEVDSVVAEDTRVTAKLLARYAIKKPLLSLRARSPRAAFERVAMLVASGKSVAYVTDAGTPGISDPGGLLVQLVRERCGEGAIVPIPGPSALTAALSVSGLPFSEFLFVGFLPHKKGRQKKLDQALASGYALVCYESPHRIQKLFLELVDKAPDRHAVIARELTKLYEQVAVGSVRELSERIGHDIPVRGEFVVVLSAC